MMVDKGQELSFDPDQLFRTFLQQFVKAILLGFGTERRLPIHNTDFEKAHSSLHEIFADNLHGRFALGFPDLNHVDLH